MFKKPVTQERYTEVNQKLRDLLGNWYPKMNNLHELKDKYGDGEWKKTPLPACRARSVKEAWSDMPKAAEDYLRSLPEFDETVFNKVTGRNE